MRLPSKSLLVAAVALSVGAGNALAWSNQQKQRQGSAQENQVSISKLKARQIALDRVPGGTVKSEQLETQGGSPPAWVINIAQYREPEHVTTVVVDANTGAVHSGERHAPQKK